MNPLSTNLWLRPIALTVVLLALTACNLPSGGNTQATLEAQLTLAAAATQGTPVGDIFSSTPIPTFLPAATLTQRPTDPPLAVTLVTTGNPPATAAPPQPTTGSSSNPVPTVTLRAPVATAAPTIPLANRPAFTAAGGDANSPAIAIDGDLSEWGDRFPYTAATNVFGPENYTGSADLSAVFALAWNKTYLYIAARVTDDAHVQTATDVNLFLGDSAEILFDADLLGDINQTSLGSDDYQIGLSPGNFSTLSPESWLWFPREKTGRPTNVQVAAQPTSLGYNIEAAIPWALFGVTPAVSNRYGFLFSLSDNDNPTQAVQQSMVSAAAGRRLTNPTTWGVLTLNP